MEPEAKKYYTRTVLDSSNNTMEIPFYECQHCRQMIPKVDECKDCGCPYSHLTTVENFETGCLHFIYECSGCPEDKRKAQKIIKIIEDIHKSKSNRAKDLADDFLRSGGY
jgi:hypothetical protein